VVEFDALVGEVQARHPELRPGQMFGVPCLKRPDGKVVACLWKDGGHAGKLVDEDARRAALELAGADLFDPGMGRPMREWVLVPAAANREWVGLVDRALA
jgi:hypothetical protein